MGRRCAHCYRYSTSLYCFLLNNTKTQTIILVFSFWYEIVRKMFCCWNDSNISSNKWRKRKICWVEKTRNDFPFFMSLAQVTNINFVFFSVSSYLENQIFYWFFFLKILLLSNFIFFLEYIRVEPDSQVNSNKKQMMMENDFYCFDVWLSIA